MTKTPPFDLAQNQLLLGDMFTILEQVPDGSFDLVVTDPPFFVMNKKNLKFKNRTDIIQSAAFDTDFQTYEEFLAFTKKWMTLTVQKMKENASIYVFFGAQYISDLLRIGLDLELTYKGILVWHKTNPAPKIRKSGYLSSTELILFLTRGKPTFNFLGQKKMHNFFETSIVMSPERLKDTTILRKGRHPTLHPTQKPLKVIKHLITVSSNISDSVLDPFAGTGTTNAACKELDRFCLGIECNAKYVDAAQERVDQVTPSPLAQK
jgi:site-specific DNA-methyltransferase (adenine-specific)/modification methylase